MRSISLNTDFLVHTAEPDRLLSKISDHGILIENVYIDNTFTIKFSTKAKHYKEIQYLLKQWNVDFQVQQTNNDLLSKRKFLSRPVLKLSLICLLIISIYIQGRVLFIEIEGNQNIPTNQIVEIAECNGIHLGSKTTDVRSERVKNNLLAGISDLQWVGVTTNGCVATIHVIEKNLDTENKTNTVAPISSIVASRDGIISSYTAKQGTIMCTPGQVVSKGEVLISGYIDCGILVKGLNAQGEVYAQTVHNLKTVSPVLRQKRTAQITKTTSYGIRVGKKLIFFNNNSRISYANCVKIYDEHCMVLPGGFALPVFIVKETVTSHVVDQNYMQDANDTSFVRDYTRAYLFNHMVAGEISEQHESVSRTDCAFVFNGRYVCTEMIGRNKSEEFIQGESHGN